MLNSIGHNVFPQNLISENSIDVGKTPQIYITKSTEKIIVDGVLNEKTWKNIDPKSHFSQYFPTDSLLATGDTEIFISYDDHYLYVAAKCYSIGNNFRVESFKRDFSFSRNDNINFIFDTYFDRTNAFQFSMNPIGAQKEALISIGGKNSDAIDGSWDCKWFGESKIFDDHWICEIAIPLNSIRFKEGGTVWGFNSYRNDSQANEISCYMNIPREYNLMNLNYTAHIIWEKPPRLSNKNYALIPYVTSGSVRDFENLDQLGYDHNLNFGADAKIGISSSLNLDLTVNPDFSQVEVDQQVNNLGRFEISFPEKRQFFLENADLFGGFGSNRVQPFFSRRIGVSIDTTTENNIQNTIYGGVRLSGKLNEDFRIGFLTLQSASQPKNDLPSFNYSVFTAEHQVYDRSNIGLIFINKQGFNTENFGNTVNKYNRVAGLEYRLHSENNFWTGKLSYMQAFTPEVKSMKYTSFGTLEYNRRRYRLEFGTMLVGDGFNAEVGFVPRKDFVLFSPEFDYRFFPKSPKIAQMTILADFRWIYKLGLDQNQIIENFALEERSMELGYDISFKNNHKFNMMVEYENFTLLRDFDPTRVQDDSLFFVAGSKPENTTIAVSYDTDVRKSFFMNLTPSFGSYYGGIRYGINGQFSYRFQPYGSFSLDYNYTYIDLGMNFRKAKLWLVGPRVELTFSRNLFWTTFIQYNNRLENFNINSRFQWRFASVSDFFLVYTDNYDTGHLGNFTSRNRAFVAKITYWLN